MVEALDFSTSEAHELEVLYRASGIQYRYSVLEDYTKSIGDFQFYPNNKGLDPFPSVRDRMTLYQKEALPLALAAIMDMADSSSIAETTHLITASCTGMYAPGLDLELVAALNLSPHVERTAINYMGCYAAFNALKLADQFCKNNPNAKVLIVCLELCSIHFQKEKDQDSLLSNALFGDGAAAVIVESKPGKKSFCFEGFHCDIVPKGKDDMAWRISDFGFEMKLSTYVPDMIREGIGTLTNRLMAQAGGTSQIDYYAIHPGGKRILQAIEQALGISKEANQLAYEVLRAYGNMSSPTVLFVLRKLMDRLNAEDHDKQVLSFAFGPGLTLESMLLKVYAQ